MILGRFSTHRRGPHERSVPAPRCRGAVPRDAGNLTTIYVIHVVHDDWAGFPPPPPSASSLKFWGDRDQEDITIKVYVPFITSRFSFHFTDSRRQSLFTYLANAATGFIHRQLLTTIRDLFPGVASLSGWPLQRQRYGKSAG